MQSLCKWKNLCLLFVIGQTLDVSLHVATELLQTLGHQLLVLVLLQHQQWLDSFGQELAALTVQIWLETSLYTPWKQ